MRYFFNNSDTAVELALQGLLSLTEIPLERVDEHLAVVYRGNTNRRIKLVVGGGSGHEPLFLGVAGPGMADGAVNGLVQCIIDLVIVYLLSLVGVNKTVEIGAA
jgi:dihydroxyacetone kinase-like protein